LLASDVAKMRTKRPPHRPSQSPSAVKVAAAAVNQHTWSNGAAVKPVVGQAAASGAGVLPALYANHDGTITVTPSADQKPNILSSYK